MPGLAVLGHSSVLGTLTQVNSMAHLMSAVTVWPHVVRVDPADRLRPPGCIQGVQVDPSDGFNRSQWPAVPSKTRLESYEAPES